MIVAVPLDDDPFTRRTATPATLLPWIGRIARDLPAQMGLYARRPAIDRSLRERIMMAVTDVNGCRYCSWIHGGWSELVAKGPEARDDIALAYAREAAETGSLPPSTEARAALEEVFSADEVRAIDAAVANIEVANLAGNTVDGLIARLTGARPRDPGAMLEEAAVVAAAAPIGLPLLALGTLFREAARRMPAVEIVTPDPGEANILVMMGAELLKKYRDVPFVRALAAGRLPFALGLRSVAMEATIRLSESHIALENGIADDVALIIEGEPDALLAVATGEVNPLTLVNEGRLTASVP
jgi:AhpD family alkylhydroperoxidase